MPGELEDRPLSSVLGDSELVNERKMQLQKCMMVHFNPSTQDVESLLVQDQSYLHSELQASQGYVE